MLFCDSYAAFIVFISSAFFILSATRGNEHHECLRPCADDPSTRKLCQYEFYVSAIYTKNSSCNDSRHNNDIPKCKGRGGETFLGINGITPGPSIEVCIGDTIEVRVHNKLGTEELSVHWHGLRQQGSVHMDGVPMVTQCPILPYSSFRYKIKPEETGTYFYHAHSVSQQADGVYGSLTVRGPQDDPTLERIYLLSSRPPTSLTRYLHLHPPTPSQLLLNGQNDGTILLVRSGTEYLLRLVNANAYDCPVLLSTYGHRFQVVATDGNLVQSMRAAQAVLFSGERLDIRIKADQPSGKYLMDIKGLHDCQDLRHEAYILYEDADVDSTIISGTDVLQADDYVLVERGYDCREISENLVCTLDLKGTTEALSNEVDERLYIPFDVNTYPSFTDEMTDNRYNLYGFTYYPSYLSIKCGEIRVPQVNGVSFKYPSSPILSQPQDIPEDLMCSLESRSKQCADTPLFCECMQVIEVPAMKNVEIVLIDEGFGGNISHTFHLHGYRANIVGRGSFGRPTTKEEVMRLDSEKKLHRNLKSPPLKDSFVIPNKGYVIFRFYTDNLGYWLFEARNKKVSQDADGFGMQFIVKVGSCQSSLPIPLNFPTCGNNKGPDLIFEMH